MLTIYSLLIRFYFCAIWFASLFHWKAKLFIQYRRKWQSQLEAKLFSHHPKILIICPSIGEFQECRSFTDRITNEKSDYQFIYAFHSPSGFDQANIVGKNAVRMMLPMDCQRNAVQLLDIIKPEEVYILSTGVWPFYVREFQKRHIPLYLISFQGWQHSSLFNPWLLNIYKPLFSSFRIIFCYNENAKRLICDNFSCNNVVITGNLRFDSVIEMKKKLRKIKNIEEFVNCRFCIVAGSTERKEDLLLAKAFKNLRHLDIKWIIVPHEKRPCALNRLRKLFKEEACFYSRNLTNNKKVLIYDITGDLFQLYQYANLCLVGRGFERAEIHNMLEPAVFLKPVLIGPKHKRFDEPKLFIKNKLTFEFNNEFQLTHLIRQIFRNELQIDCNAIKKIFEERSKGTEIVMESLHNSWQKLHY